jgi:hypothetical protein
MTRNRWRQGRDRRQLTSDYTRQHSLWKERISARLLNDEIKANLCLAVTSQQKKNSFETPPCKILKGRWAAVSLL